MSIPWFYVFTGRREFIYIQCYRSDSSGTATSATKSTLWPKVNHFHSEYLVFDILHPFESLNVALVCSSNAVGRSCQAFRSFPPGQAAPKIGKYDPTSVLSLQNEQAQDGLACGLILNQRRSSETAPREKIFLEVFRRHCRLLQENVVPHLEIQS